MEPKNSRDAALYVWEYFYLSCFPTDNEAKVWSRIECATIRIRESEPCLADKYPAPVRLRNAKRVRRATREIVRLVEQLETVPDLSIARALGLLERAAEVAIERSRSEASERPLH